MTDMEYIRKKLSVEEYNTKVKFMLSKWYIYTKEQTQQQIGTISK